MGSSSRKSLVSRPRKTRSSSSVSYKKKQGDFKMVFTVLTKVFAAVVVFMVMLASSAPAPGWLCAEDTPAAYANFCQTGRRLTEVELGVINRIFNTDKRVVGSTIKRFD